MDDGRQITDHRLLSIPYRLPHIVYRLWSIVLTHNGDLATTNILARDAKLVGQFYSAQL